MSDKSRFSMEQLEGLYRGASEQDLRHAFDVMRLRVAEAMVALRDRIEADAESRDLLSLLFDLYDEIDDMETAYLQLLKVRRVGARLYYVSEEVAPQG